MSKSVDKILDVLEKNKKKISENDYKEGVEALQKLNKQTGTRVSVNVKYYGLRKYTHQQFDCDDEEEQLLEEMEIRDEYYMGEYCYFEHSYDTNIKLDCHFDSDCDSKKISDKCPHCLLRKTKYSVFDRHRFNYLCDSENEIKELTEVPVYSKLGNVSIITYSPRLEYIVEIIE